MLSANKSRSCQPQAEMRTFSIVTLLYLVIHAMFKPIFLTITLVRLELTFRIFSLSLTLASLLLRLFSIYSSSGLGSKQPFSCNQSLSHYNDGDVSSLKTNKQTNKVQQELFTAADSAHVWASGEHLQSHCRFIFNWNVCAEG